MKIHIALILVIIVFAFLLQTTLTYIGWNCFLTKVFEVGNLTFKDSSWLSIALDFILSPVIASHSVNNNK